MWTRANRCAIAMALVVVFSAGLLGTVSAQEGEQAILDTFKRGITLYETGEYDQAKEAFDQVLAQQPGMQTALKMRDMAELGQFVQMRDDEKLGPEARQILDLMMRAVRETRRTVESPERLVGDFQSPDLAVYGKAMVELRGHGPYAVPHVVHLLAIEEPGKQNIAGRAISLLAGTHKDACLPLVRVLQGTDNELLKSQVAGVLGQIGDRRAVPALVSAWEDEGLLGATRRAAARALESVTGRSAAELGTAVAQYVALATAYFEEDKAVVRHTYGLTADVWEWDAAGAALADKVVYEEVPAYLYYQRMATEMALEGLQVDPANLDLQAVLAASLVRQLALCEFFKSTDVRFGGQGVAQEVCDDAAGRAAELAVEVPVVLSLLESPVLASALQMTLKAGDGAAALFLVRTLGGKLAAAGPAPPDAVTIRALIDALDSGDKDVRYNAAIVLVCSCPTGECGAADRITQVISAALRAASTRNALVVMDDLQMRNTLGAVVRGEGVATTEATVDEERIESVLSLQPSVDIVFLSGNAPEHTFKKIMALLSGDPRTKAAPVYVVVDPGEPSAEVSKYAGIEEVLLPDDLRAAKLQPILQEKVLSESRSAFTEEEEAVVLRAAQALQAVAPLRTEYELQTLAPSLVRALIGYSEEVTAVAAGCLAGFGSEAAIEPLSQIVAGEASVGVKVIACRALAAVFKRTRAEASETVAAVLKDALAADEQELREAAAEALSVAGLDWGELLLLLRQEGLAGK
ncbi:MAG: HEAT repeat domain-containing protein [Candidatus Brocadiae bacterium]|nr:HEAT repeat domain-containing protein [Candidatus Brocadiia bacterium]